MRVIGPVLFPLLVGLALLGLGCKEAVLAPAGLSYSANPATYSVGVAIAPNTPSQTGGAVASYAVSPALPAGLSLNTTTGVITGTPTAAAAQATYVVTATNATGNATVSLILTVGGTTVAITTQPKSQAVTVGQAATFSVAATGSGTLTYQWTKDGVALAGATSASYTTPAATLADSGSAFAVQVSDGFGGSATSLDAALTVTNATASGTFSGSGRMAAARVNHTATVLANGQVLLVGGSNGGSSLATAELYDPATGGFSATGSLNTARQNHTATLLPSGKVLIAGGTLGAGNSTTALGTAEIFDPTTGTFALTPGSLFTGRSGHTATLLASGKVLIAGGQSAGAPLASAELFDPAAQTFTATAHAMGTTRTSHTATLLTSSGKVLIIGGFSSAALTGAELYDPVADAFTATGSLLVPRFEHTATLLPGDKVLVLGGADSQTAEVYDPASGGGSFTAITGATIRQRGHAAALLSTGQVLVCGGVGTGSTPAVLATADLFDPGTGTFAATGSMTVVREYHGLVALPGGKALVAGGSGGSFLATSEIYY